MLHFLYVLPYDVLISVVPIFDSVGQISVFE